MKGSVAGGSDILPATRRIGLRRVTSRVMAQRRNTSWQRYVVAGVLAQPSGSRPEARDMFYETNMKGWGPALTAKRQDITMAMVDKYLTKMYRNNPDFVISVTRDFVKSCQTPVLILPDDIPAHPYAVAMEAALLAPKAEVSIFPWKEPKERIPLAVRQIRSFLKAHQPT